MSAIDYGCPTCLVAAGQKCRTRGSKRITDTHSARFEISSRRWIEAIRERREGKT